MLIQLTNNYPFSLALTIYPLKYLRFYLFPFLIFFQSWYIEYGVKYIYLSPVKWLKPTLIQLSSGEPFKYLGLIRVLFLRYSKIHILSKLLCCLNRISNIICSFHKVNISEILRMSDSNKKEDWLLFQWIQIWVSSYLNRASGLEYIKTKLYLNHLLLLSSLCVLIILLTLSCVCKYKNRL